MANKQNQKHTSTYIQFYTYPQTSSNLNKVRKINARNISCAFNYEMDMYIYDCNISLNHTFINKSININTNSNVLHIFFRQAWLSQLQLHGHKWNIFHSMEMHVHVLQFNYVFYSNNKYEQLNGVVTQHLWPVQKVYLSLDLVQTACSIETI